MWPPSLFLKEPCSGNVSLPRLPQPKLLTSRNSVALWCGQMLHPTCRLVGSYLHHWRSRISSWLNFTFSCFAATSALPSDPKNVSGGSTTRLLRIPRSSLRVKAFTPLRSPLTSPLQSPRFCVLCAFFSRSVNLADIARKISRRRRWQSFTTGPL